MEELLLDGDAFVEGKPDSRLDRVDGALRRLEARPFADRPLTHRGEDRGIRAELLIPVARFRHGSRRHLPRESHGAGQQISFDNAVQDAARQRLLGFHRLTEHAHFERFWRGRPSAAQPLRPPGAGNQTQLHFRLSHLRRIQGYAVVASHRGLEAAAERRAVNRGHHGLRAILDSRERSQQTDVRLLARGDLFEFANVRAGNERPPAADQNDGPHGLVGNRLLDRRGDSLRDPGTQSVHWRILDREDGDFPVFAKGYEFSHTYIFPRTRPAQSGTQSGRD